MGDADHIDAFLDQLEDAAARMLLEAAVVLQREATADYRKGFNPPPYHDKQGRSTAAPKGEFPYVRTGFLASGILMVPADVGAVRREKRVRVGYAAAAFYGIALGNRGWKWLKDTLSRVEPQMRVAIDGAGVITMKG